MKIEYKLAFGTTLKDFEESVNRHLAEGWKLHGQLVVSPTAIAGCYFQALTRALS